MFVVMKKKNELLQRISEAHEVWGRDVQAAISIEGGEELVEDSLSYVLHLRAHAYGLRTDVHGENLGGPNPCRGAP